MSDYYALSLDIGTCTGFALQCNSTIIASGSFDMGGLPSGMNRKGYRLQRFFDFLQDFQFVDDIIIERVTRHHFKSQDAATCHMHLQGIIYFFCSLNKMTEPQLIDTSELKKLFTGIGNAKKEVIGKRATELGWTGAVWDTTGSSLINHDEADAIALLYVSAIKSGSQIGW